MAKNLYVSPNGTARKAKKIYVGVNNVARKVKFGYIGASNKAHLFFSGKTIEFKKVNMPTTGTWSGVTYGNGKFVAVERNTDNGAYSADGENWSTFSLPFSAQWESVAYGAGRFVAVASASSRKAAYSTNGTTWNETSLPRSGAWVSVAYGDGKFVSADTTGSIYSTNGTLWSEGYDFTSDLSFIPQNLIHSGTGFLCLGGQVESASSVPVKTLPKMYYSSNYSSDGGVWHPISYTVDGSAFYGGAYGEGTTVVLADSILPIYSDGSTWYTGNDLEEIGTYYGVAYGDGMFVAMPYSGNRFIFSEDGINWEYSDYLSFTPNSMSMCYGNGKFVSVGHYGTCVVSTK